MAMTPLSTFKVLEGNDALVDSDINKNNIQWKLDDMISYIKEQLSHDMDLQDSDAVERSMLTSASELHMVHTFLANPDPERPLGDLFRTTASNGGHGKWPPTELLLDVVELNNGKICEHQGKVVVSCNYMATATQVCSALQENHGVHELDLTLQWDTSKNDIQGICDALQTSKFDPIVNLFANGHLREFSFRGCDWFVDGTTDIGCPSIMSLHKLHLGLKPFEDASKQRFSQLLQRLPNLIHLSLYSGDDVNVYDLVHDWLGDLPRLET
ncbi:hypothetical protein BGZ65_012697, partial [Modicella reniformis]